METVLSNEPTKRQKEVLAFILKYMRKNQVAPTIREICHAFGFSGTNAVASHLSGLEAKGFIEIESNVSRGIRVVAHGVKCPFCGK